MISRACFRSAAMTMMVAALARTEVGTPIAEGGEEDSEQGEDEALAPALPTDEPSLAAGGGRRHSSVGTLDVDLGLLFVSGRPKRASEECGPR